MPIVPFSVGAAPVRLSKAGQEGPFTIINRDTTNACLISTDPAVGANDSVRLPAGGRIAVARHRLAVGRHKRTGGITDHDARMD